MSLPVEIHLKIADSIRNMWDRQNYVEAIGIDNLYYGKNRSRPVPKGFNPFPILPSSRKLPPYSDFLRKRMRLILPIKNEKVKHPKSYRVTLDYWTNFKYNMDDIYFSETELMRGRKSEFLEYWSRP